MASGHAIFSGLSIVYRLFILFLLRSGCVVSPGNNPVFLGMRRRCADLEEKGHLPGILN